MQPPAGQPIGFWTLRAGEAVRARIRAALAEVGVTQDRFTPAAWKKATVNDTVYAIPLDTHPWVMFYNVAMAKKAGLLDSSGKKLKPMKGQEDFLDALKAMKQATGKYGAVATITVDPSTCWRFFMMLYSGVAGPIVGDQGTRVTIDRDAMEHTFAFMQQLTTKSGLMPTTATATTSTTFFSQAKAGFLFDGEWQIPTYRGVKQADGKTLDFNVVPFPAILGDDPAAYADSHSLIIPTSSGRSKARSADAVSFVKGLLEESSVWAGGGHIPAWLPVQKSQSFLKQEPQSNYTQAAFDAVYDPVAWYTGAGSDFQTAMGSVIADVLSGHTSPQGGVRAMTTSLKTFSTARPPVG